MNKLQAHHHSSCAARTSYLNNLRRSSSRRSSSTRSFSPPSLGSNGRGRLLEYSRLGTDTRAATGRTERLATAPLLVNRARASILTYISWQWLKNDWAVLILYKNSAKRPNRTKTVVWVVVQIPYILYWYEGFFVHYSRPCVVIPIPIYCFALDFLSLKTSEYSLWTKKRALSISLFMVHIEKSVLGLRSGSYFWSLN